MACILLETALGDLVIDLVDNALGKNFVKLAKARYYSSSLVFAIDHHAAYLGDPTGTGEGGGSIFALIDSERDIEKSEKRFLRSVDTETHIKRGQVVATLIRNLPHTVGSQFTVSLRDYESPVPVPVIGKVVEDESETLDQLLSMPCDKDGRPLADIRIKRALVVHDPYPDPDHFERLLQDRGVVIEDGRAVSSPSPEKPIEESIPTRLPYNPDDLREETAEETARIEDRGRAVVLELLGDLPDADIEAPKEVLFVCKLNPVTTDEDLELIFSRFDEKVKVEIIRDHETKQSLQYAFVEFTSQQAANEAFFKMNNALIDDRRIKVDFSQSVAKLWDKFRQKSRMPQFKSFEGKSTPKGHGKHRSRSRDGNDRDSQRREHSHGHNRQREYSPRQSRQLDDRPGASDERNSWGRTRQEIDDFGRERRFSRDHHDRDHRERHYDDYRRRDEDRDYHTRRDNDRYSRKRSHSDDDSYERRKKRKKDEKRAKKEHKHEKKEKRHKKHHRSRDRRSRSRSKT